MELHTHLKPHWQVGAFIRILPQRPWGAVDKLQPTSGSCSALTRRATLGPARLLLSSCSFSDLSTCCRRISFCASALSPVPWPHVSMSSSSEGPSPQRGAEVGSIFASSAVSSPLLQPLMRQGGPPTLLLLFREICETAESSFKALALMTHTAVRDGALAYSAHLEIQGACSISCSSRFQNSAEELSKTGRQRSFISKSHCLQVSAASAGSRFRCAS